MSSYIVEEKVLYRVDADSEEEAIEHIVNDERRDKHCIGVDERIAYLDERFDG
jgi:hypothetical protein